MTKKVTMIAEADLDKQTVTISEENKVGSMFLLTPQEVTISAKQIQNLIFRKSKNSNYPMFCTGFQYNQEWYGDRPDDGVWINPFENMQKYQRTGETNVRYTSEPSEDKPNRLILQETYSGVQIIVESKNDNLYSLPQLTDVTQNGIKLGDLVPWEVFDDGSFYYQKSTSAVVSFRSTATLEFTYNDQRYRVTLPKVADDGGAGTFAIEFDKNNQFYMAITTEASFIPISSESSEDSPNRLIVKETDSGVRVIVESKNDDLGSLPQLTDVTYNGTPLGNLDSWDALNNGSFYQQFYFTVLSFQTVALLEFTYNEQRYRVILPRVAEDVVDVTFVIGFDENKQFYHAITTDTSFIPIS